MSEKYLKNLIEIFLSINNYKLMKDFLEGILTRKELDEIPRRLEIVKRLNQEQSHHGIARDLGVGVATVSRGSRELKAGRFKILKRNKYKAK